MNETNYLTLSLFSPLAGYLLLVYAFFAIARRQYAAVSLLSYAMLGLGTTNLFVVKYAQAVCALQSLLVAYLFLAALREKKEDSRRWRFAPGSLKVLLGLTAVILLKIVAETLMEGLDEFAIQAASYFLVNVLLPSLTLALAITLQGFKKAFDDFIVGSLVLSVIWVVTGFVGAVVDQSLIGFLAGMQRLTLHNRDPISSVRLLPIIFLSLVYLFLLRSNVWQKTLALVSCVSVFPVIILNGNRQYLLCILACAAAVALLCRRSVLRQVFIVLVVAGSFSYFLRSFGEESNLSQRLSPDLISNEGRLAIWQDALQFASEFPLFGGGFRSYGAEIITINKESGDVVLNKDNAHGLFMDVLTDHGFVLAISYLCTFFFAAAQVFFRALRTKDEAIRIAFIQFLAFPVTIFLSGTFWNVTYFFVPLVAALAAYSHSVSGDALVHQRASPRRLVISPASPASTFSH